MKKKFLVLATAFAMTFSFTACSIGSFEFGFNKEDDDDDDDDDDDKKKDKDEDKDSDKDKDNDTDKKGGLFGNKGDDTEESDKDDEEDKDDTDTDADDDKGSDDDDSSSGLSGLFGGNDADEDDDDDESYTPSAGSVSSSDMTEYVCNELTLSLPADWDVLDKDSDEYVIAASYTVPGSDEENAVIFVNIVDESGALIPVSDYVETIISTVGSENYNIDPKRTISFNGGTAYTYNFNTPIDDSSSGYGFFSLFDNGSKVYLVTYLADESTYATSKDVADSVVASIKF